MKTLNTPFGRREFLKQAAQTAGAGALLSRGSPLKAAPAAPTPKNDRAGSIPNRTLGKTGLKLPMLGYGGAALPTVWGNPLSYEDRVDLVRYAYDRGIRYFDTSPVYMESEKILGEALQEGDRRRHSCLVTKVESTQPEEVRKLVERSLKTLATDYLDIVLIHGTPGLEQMTVAEAMNIHAELAKLRDERLTRFVGFSAHGYFDKALALIATGGFDVCMLSYGYIPRGYDQIWSARMTNLRNACVARAHELGMGIVAMKVLGAGLLGAWARYVIPESKPEILKQLPAAAIHYVRQDPRIHLLNIGMRLKGEIDANFALLAEDGSLTPEDRALLADFSARLFDSAAIKGMRIE